MFVDQMIITFCSFLFMFMFMSTLMLMLILRWIDLTLSRHYKNMKAEERNKTKPNKLFELFMIEFLQTHLWPNKSSCNLMHYFHSIISLIIIMTLSFSITKVSFVTIYSSFLIIIYFIWFYFTFHHLHFIILCLHN